MNGGTLMVLLICLGAFAMVFGIAYLKNRETMAMIEKGMNPAQKTRPKSVSNLKNGLLFIGAGIGLLIAYLLDNFVFSGVHSHMMNSYDSDNPALYFALIAIGGGIGLFFSYRIERNDASKKTQD